MSKQISKKYQKMNQVEHVLKLPDTYVGSVERQRDIINVIQKHVQDEKEIIRGLQGTAEGRVLSKILGPDIMGLIRLRKPTKTVVRRGLGTR